MKTLIVLVLISMIGAIPVKDVQKLLAAKAFRELHTKLERPAPAYRMRRQADDQDAQTEYTVKYCPDPESTTLSGTAFKIIRQTIQDLVEPSCPETLTGDPCEDYKSEVRTCIATILPEFIDKIDKETFILTEEEKQELTKMDMVLGISV